MKMEVIYNSAMYTDKPSYWFHTKHGDPELRFNDPIAALGCHRDELEFIRHLNSFVEATGDDIENDPVLVRIYNDVMKIISFNYKKVIFRDGHKNIRCTDLNILEEQLLDKYSNLSYDERLDKYGCDFLGIIIKHKVINANYIKYKEGYVKNLKGINRLLSKCNILGIAPYENAAMFKNLI